MCGFVGGCGYVCTYVYVCKVHVYAYMHECMYARMYLHYLILFASLYVIKLV